MSKGKHIHNSEKRIDFHRRKLALPKEVQDSVNSQLQEIYKSSAVVSLREMSEEKRKEMVRMYGWVQ